MLVIEAQFLIVAAGFVLFVEPALPGFVPLLELAVVEIVSLVGATAVVSLFVLRVDPLVAAFVPLAGTTAVVAAFVLRVDPLVTAFVPLIEPAAEFVSFVAATALVAMSHRQSILKHIFPCHPGGCSS